MDIIEDVLILPVEKPLKILHITDLHLLFCGEGEEGMRSLSESRKDYFPRSEEVLTELKEVFGEESPDFLILTGDMVDFPSQKNLEELESLVEAAGCPFLWVPGNHDWSLPEEYQSEAQYKRYMPLFDRFDGGNPDFQVKRIGGIRFIGVDNSRDRVGEDTLKAMEKELALPGREPTIVCTHVPFYAETLIEDVLRVWKEPIVIGHEGSDKTTKKFCRLVAQKAAAVITGHIHFEHTDLLPGDSCLQLTTALAAEGHIRRILIEPR